VGAVDHFSFSIAVGGLLVQTAHEIDCAQVRVALQHFEFPVPGDRSDLDEVQAAFEQAGHGFVAQVVKVQVWHSGANTEVFERKADRVS